MNPARYTYRFYPTPKQTEHFAQLFGCVRVTYNWGLQRGLEALQAEARLPRLPTLSKALTQLKKSESHAWLADVSCVPLQQVLRHLDVAWTNCFEKRAKRPRFKRKDEAQSAEFTRSAMRVTAEGVRLGKISGPLDIRWSRELPSDPSSCTVTLDRAGRYHISFVVQVEAHALEPIEQAVGVDLGLTHFAILSTGEKIDNPRFLQKDLDRLAQAQKKLARKQKGSSNRRKQRLKVAKLHAKIVQKRKDFAHKLSTRLIRENQAIAVETLAVKNMVRNRSLARSISDAGWGMFVKMLEYKAKWYGRRLVKIDRWCPSSKRCSRCEHQLESLSLSVRTWACPACSVVHDRDVNAAKNIVRAAGLADLVKHARGEKTSEPKQLALLLA